AAFRHTVAIHGALPIFWSGSGDRSTTAAGDVAAAGGIDSEHSRIIGRIGDLIDDQVTALGVGDGAVDGQAGANNDGLAGISGLISTGHTGERQAGSNLS